MELADRDALIPGRHPFWAEQTYVVFMLGVTTLGAIAAVWLALRDGLDAFYLWLLLATILYTTFGVTAGLHRYFSHRAFRCKRPFEIALALLGISAGQDFFVRWVYVHRVHHRFTDAPGDPHSPFYDRHGPTGDARGLLHSHIGWLFSREPSVTPDVVPDLLRDRTLMRFDALSPWITAAGVLLPGFIALLYAPTLHSFVLGVLWGGFVRLFLMYHLSWGVNSLGHRFGPKVDGQRHNARNNPWLGVITLGDGWHANHHEHAAAARHGYSWQLDITWLALKAFERIGWVSGMRTRRERDELRLG